MAEITREEIEEMVAMAVAKVVNDKPAQQLYRAGTVAKMLDVSATTVWRYVDRGILPEPISLTDGCKVFDAEVINSYIAGLTTAATQ